MPWSERATVVESLKYVDEVFAFDDSDNTAIDAIKYIRNKYYYADLVFANGGDRNENNIPEMSCGIERLEYRFGIGGSHKMNSSSWILEKWKNNGNGS